MPITEGMELASGSYTVKHIFRGGFSQVLIVEDLAQLTRAIKMVREERWLAAPDKKALTKAFIETAALWEKRLRNCPYCASALMLLADFYGMGPVIFMEVVDGPSLQVLRSKVSRLSVTQTVRIASQI